MALHLCTQMRGFREIDSTTPRYCRGNNDTDPQLRSDFFGLCGRRA